MSRMPADVLLVGSIPGANAAEAMQSCATGIGKHLNCLPDGETGNRRIWINFLAATVYDTNAGIRTLNRPLPVEPGHAEEWRGAGENWAPRGYEDHWQFELQNGVTALNFPSLGYAEVAIESYQTFKRLRAAGTIPPGVRFMVAIPLVESAVRIFFANAEDYPIVREAYQAALQPEIDKILAAIPADELAIQWDICMEILAIELNDQQPGLFPWEGPGDPKQRFLSSLEHACSLIPEEALVGCHLCYGDLGHKHVIEPQNLSVVVDLANAAQQKTDRDIDFFHMPVPRDRDDPAYVAPLSDLDIAPGKLFLGLIHHTDGIDGATRRIAQAKQVIDDFGIATECGFGRRPVEQIPALLEIHHQALEVLHTG